MKKSYFNLSHYKNIAMQMGALVPTLCLECVPGDKHTISNKAFIRMAPQVFPTMHNVYVETFYFKVPHRLIWDDFQKFRTGGVANDDNTPHPISASPDDEAGYLVGSLADYFGLPTGVRNFGHNILQFRAYNFIYNEFFRDQTLQDEVAISRGNGFDDVTSKELQFACWQKDKFTSALPFEQRGAPVTVPVVSDITGTVSIPAIDGGFKVNGVSADVKTYNAVGQDKNLVAVGVAGDKPVTVSIPAQDDLELDINSDDFTVTTINDLRLAFQLQRYAEKLARYGARYVEFLLGFFGVVSSDKTLQRPQFLGSATSQVVFSEVLQTSSTDGTSPQGNMAGHGISAQKTSKIKTYCEEDCFIIGISVVRPQTMYMQGIEKQWTRYSRYDYFNPTFVNLGEQPILNREVYAQGNRVLVEGTPSGQEENPAYFVDYKTFGFEPRYEEFRRIPNTVHGDFRDNLMDWHMARKFDNLPVLGSEFVKCSPTNRTFAVQTENNQNVYFTIKNEIESLRPLPKRGVPGLIDHN